MNPSENLRFEELVCAYLDGGLQPEQEFELLQMIEHPEYARLFAELARQDGEIKGTLATPVTDENMAGVVSREISYRDGSQSRRQSRVYQAVMGEIGSESRRPVHAMPILPLPQVQPKQPERPFFHWTMAVSAVLHAAVIALVIALHFSGSRHTQQTVQAPEPPRVLQPEIQPETVPYKQAEAKIFRSRGEAFSIQDENRQQAQLGKPLNDNDILETVGTKSSIDIRFDDNTQVNLHPDSRMRKLGGQEAYANSKCIYLERGTLSASVSPQPAQSPMRMITPNAEAMILGTKFQLATYPGQTQLEVTEGLVKFTRLSDGKSVDVKAGSYAIVAEGVDLAVYPRGSRRFMKGINFFGPAVTIDGMRWMSHEQAMRDGMSLVYNLRGSSSHRASFTPDPPVDAQTRAMLDTRVYSIDDDVGIYVPSANGTVEVEMYVFETFKPFSRVFDVEINGTMAQRGVGKMPLYRWTKIGPYRTEVKNGMLHVKIHKVVGNPVISGLTLYSVDTARN